MSHPILIVEDDKLQQKMLGTLLQRKLGFKSLCASNGREALKILEDDTDRTINLIILDLDMPVMGGMETLEIISQRYPALAVIMLTGNEDIDNVVLAMKLGATDFITKPYEGDRMTITIKNAFKISTLSNEVRRLTNEKEGTFSFENLIGHTSGLSKTVNISRKAAASSIPVLITGETGVGKEVLAQAIHGESERAGNAFIAVNCGAIPYQLVESTLFGHEKGSFTGATEKTIGKFREAEGGTIFLDEIGELPLDSQVKLLRVLQQKEIEPVGGGKAVPVDIRIISATNRDLMEDIKVARFREDLYFRLNVLEVKLPPLRERKQDIPVLGRHFIERFCARESVLPRDLPPEVEQQLMHYDWPGNVRELENAINRAMVLGEGSTLKSEDFSKAMNAGTDNILPNPQTGEIGLSIFTPTGQFKSIDNIEKEIMILALRRYDQNITKAAKAIGMAKSTFYRKMSHQKI